jgi:hypothetical protein
MGVGRIAVVPRQIVESVTRRTVKVQGASRLQKICIRKNAPNQPTIGVAWRSGLPGRPSISRCYCAWRSLFSAQKLHRQAT